MPDEQDNTFQGRASETAADAVEAGAAALAALASGFALRVHELLALADESGSITVDVDSTAIPELRYDTVTSTMGVTFTDGSEYDVHPVSLAAFLAFVNAPSKGGHWNQHFRGQSASPWQGSTKQRIKIGRR
jgi:hypothetical protein